MKRLTRIRLAALVATASWFGFQQQSSTVSACNEYYCGNEETCGVGKACCVQGTPGQTSLNECDSNGKMCDAHTKCI